MEQTTAEWRPSGRFPTGDDLNRAYELTGRTPDWYVYDDGERACALGVVALALGADVRTADNPHFYLTERLNLTRDEVKSYENGAQEANEGVPYVLEWMGCLFSPARWAGYVAWRDVLRQHPGAYRTY